MDVARLGRHAGPLLGCPRRHSQPSITWPADAIPKPLYADPHDGLAVSRSSDAITWEQKSRILKEHGTGPRDATLARHPSVAVLDNRAFIFYHVEPDRPYPTPPAEKRTIKQKLSFLQIAELKIQNGELVCDRDQPVQIEAAVGARE